MSYTPDELIKLAESMEAGALLAEAKADVHKKLDEIDRYEHELGRAARARHFAGVARHFHAVVKRRDKQTSFTPPTIAEAIAFAQADETCKGWPLEDIKSWWRHFESNGWKLKGGMKMRDWKCAAQNGAARWRRDNSRVVGKEAPRRPVVAANGKKDPDGWRDFLRTINRPFEPFEFAPGFLQRDFHKKMRPTR